MLTIEIKNKVNNKIAFLSFSVRYMNNSSQFKRAKSNNSNNGCVEEFKEDYQYRSSSFKKNKINYNRIEDFNAFPECTQNINNNLDLLQKLDQTDSLNSKERLLLMSKNYKNPGKLFENQNNPFDNRNIVNHYDLNITGRNYGNHTTKSVLLDSDLEVIQKSNYNQTPLDHRGLDYFNPEVSSIADISSVNVDQNKLLTNLYHVTAETQKLVNKGNQGIIQVRAEVDNLVEHQKKLEKIIEKIDETQNTFLTVGFWVTSFLVLGGTILYIWNKRPNNSSPNSSPAGFQTHLPEFPKQPIPNPLNNQTTSLSDQEQQLKLFINEITTKKRLYWFVTDSFLTLTVMGIFKKYFKGPR